MGDSFEFLPSTLLVMLRRTYKNFLLVQKPCCFSTNIFHSPFCWSPWAYSFLSGKGTRLKSRSDSSPLPFLLSSFWSQMLFKKGQEMCRSKNWGRRQQGCTGRLGDGDGGLGSNRRKETRGEEKQHEWQKLERSNVQLDFTGNCRICKSVKSVTLLNNVPWQSPPK